MKILRMLGVSLAISMCAAVLSAGDLNLREGERLEYTAKFLYIIPAGDVSMKINDAAGYGNKGTFLISCEAKTAKWLSLLFKAEAVLSSYAAKGTLYPYKFEQILKIAGRQDDIRRAVYNRAANTMEAEGKGIKKVPADVRDPISAMYFLRTQDLDQDMEIAQTVNSNQSTYIFKSKVIGKKRIGKYDCWVLAAKIRRENKSMYHSMDALFYISDDERHVPVLIQAKTKVGPVELVLKGR